MNHTRSDNRIVQPIEQNFKTKKFKKEKSRKEQI